MLQGKFDYVKVTYYGQTREGYLVDVSNGVGTLVGLNTNTAFQMDKATIEVLVAGAKSFLPKSDKEQ